MEVNSRSVYGCTEAPAQLVPPAGTALTYNPKTGRVYIHLLTSPGDRLACDFGASIAYARFLHDGSEVRMERHGDQSTHVKTFYRSGNEGETYFRLPALKPDVVHPVIEVVLKKL